MLIKLKATDVLIRIMIVAVVSKPHSITQKHRSQAAEIDVAAINWSQRQLVLGEWNWGTGRVGRNVIRSLVADRGPKVVSRLDGKWQVHYAFFARTGFTAALQEAAHVGAPTAALAELDRALAG